MAKNLLLLAVIGFGVFCFTESAAAQYLPLRSAPNSRTQTFYQPSRPVLPNALNYFRGNVGQTDAFHTYIQPRAQLERTLLSQQRQLNFVTRQEQANNRDLRNIENGLTQPLVSPTGQRAQFMNYGGYFPGLSR